ncbi:CBN-RHR-1 protein, partial [Aphelenchoides avenae]
GRHWGRHSDAACWRILRSRGTARPLQGQVQHRRALWQRLPFGPFLFHSNFVAVGGLAFFQRLACYYEGESQLRPPQRHPGPCAQHYVHLSHFSHDCHKPPLFHQAHRQRFSGWWRRNCYCSVHHPHRRI